MRRPRLEVNLEELDRVLDQAREAPLSEPDYDKLKSALHALAGMLVQPRTTEKTKNVLEKPETPAPKMILSPLPIRRPATGATELRPIPARTMLPFHIPRCTLATRVRAAKKAKFTRRKNLARW